MMNVYDVIVIGAGVSGLAAASTLHKKNLNILVLEARNRMGGRVYTDHSFGLPLDLGASWLHSLSINPMTSLVDQFNLQLKTFVGSLDSADHYAFYDALGNPLKIEQIQALQQFARHFLEKLPHLPANTNLQFELQSAYRQSGLAHTLPGGDDWLAHLMTGWDGDDLNQVSIQAWQNVEELNSEQGYVTNGYDHLLQYLAQGLDICYEQIVSEIDYSDEIIKVTTHKGLYFAKKLIVTVPVAVLQAKDIQFFPALPEKKQQAIQSIGAGILDKVALKFEQVFWDRQSHLIQILPKQAGDVCSYVNYVPLTGKPVLVSLCAGDKARNLEQLADADILKQFLQPLKIIYADQFVEPIDYVITRWWADPFSKLGYSYIPVGGCEENFAVLAEPVGDQLYFAGEATSVDMNATVHGAYVSGVDAAKACSIPS